MRSCEIFVEGIGGARIVEKLVQGGVPVLAARPQKKGVIVRVDGKHRKKVFAILRGSCYNGKKTVYAGALRLVRACLKRAGLFAGALLFLAAVSFCQSRVLRIEVVGSGAYYRSEIVRTLERGGTAFFSPPPEHIPALTAHILSFPRVSFCSVSHEGGVLTVRVEVADEARPIAGGSLLAPADGVLLSLTVLAGTPRFGVGDEVRKGDVLVENAALFGEERLPVTVIAAAAVGFEAAAEYGGSREEALAQAALDFGELQNVQIQKTGKGWRVTGDAVVRASLNLG